ncbi:DUF222 domain-containing protein [Herbiconiux sp. P17]|uniref:HNH endonuclease signature motif containing protein n=1 Tax=Herbiconiux wuyangfengii TaxID=3342794 RepID=UPI0035BA2BFE
MKSWFVTRTEELDARLDAEIDELRDIDRLTAVTDARRARSLAETARIADERAALTSPTGRGSAEDREGERKLVAVEIALATRRAEQTVAKMINDAEQLVNDYPATLTALSEGRVSALHTQHRVAHAATLPAEARPEFEARLLEEAQVLPAQRFNEKARRMRETVHPESITVRNQQARDGRSVWLSPECDGMATLTHYIPAVDAVAVDDLLDKIARSERSDTDPRTHLQRRADVLTRLILTPGNPARPASITANVLVTIPATTIAGTSDEPGELHGYGPIDPDTARQIAATAPTFLRVLTRPVTGEPTVVTRHWGRAVADHLTTSSASGRDESGRDRYSAPPELRLVLAAIDQTCRFPGCGRRANRCELDHTTDWAHGGATTPENLTYLCSRHHHLKHDTRWNVEADPERPRHLNWRSPHGREYSTAPPRAPSG